MAFWLVRPDWTTHTRMIHKGSSPGLMDTSHLIANVSSILQVDPDGTISKEFAMAAFESWAVSQENYLHLADQWHISDWPNGLGAVKCQWNGILLQMLCWYYKLCNMHSCSVRKTSMENVKVFALIDIDRGEPGFLTVGNTVGRT